MVKPWLSTSLLPLASHDKVSDSVGVAGDSNAAATGGVLAMVTLFEAAWAEASKPSSAVTSQTMLSPAMNTGCASVALVCPAMSTPFFFQTKE